MVNRPAFNGSYASLVPQSGAQFLDMELPAEKNERSLVFKFYEEESFADNKNLFSRLFLVEEDENGELIKIDDGERVDPDRVYSVNFKKALELYSGHWMPLPYLRSQGQGFAQGPQLWSRVFITPRDIEDEYDVTLAFDTTVSEDTTGSWATLTPDDRILDLAHQLKSNSFLLHHEWMRDWLHRIYEIGIENRAVHRQRTANEEYAKCAHWAYFLVFLNGLKTRVEVPEIKILDTSNPHLHIKEIDFVVDIGNSRTCGLLIERPDTPSNVNLSAATLELRDLTRPHLVNDEPFRSRMEFRSAKLHGIDPALCKRAGVSRPMMWPSAARIGPEAEFLNSHTDGSEGSTGLSGPKRYLWDHKANQTVWKLNDFDEFAGKGAEKNWIGPVSRYVNTLGEVPSLFRKKETSRASLPRVISKTARETLDMSSANFSKSSMFSFFVAELVLHAMNQINSVSYRNEKGSPDVPRKLGRIILTLPTASLLLEKQIMEHRCKSGVQLLWDVANWHPFIEEYKHLEQPETIVQFDEASCSQVLYLYAEINRKYRRSIDDYFSTFGKKRQRPGESMDQSDSFRMASLDIGGGTIDLMIMTYYSSQAGHAMTSKQNFRDGFRVAGDDILHNVITEVVLPNLCKHIENEQGISARVDFQDWLSKPLTGDVKLAHKRKLFVSYVLSRLGIALLGLYEKTVDPGFSFDTFSVADLLCDDATAKQVLDMQQLLPESITQSTLALCNIEVSRNKMEVCIRGVVGDLLLSLSNVISKFDCDVLLMAGRPSRLPVIKDIILESMPVRSHRLKFLHQYQLVDSWYPYVGRNNCIDDPKTTVAVGALICSLAQQAKVENFSIQREGFRLGSIANYIGVLNQNQTIEDHRIYLNPNQLKSDSSLKLEASLIIGYRQLNDPTWPSTPLYNISPVNIHNIDDDDSLVTLSRVIPDDHEDKDFAFVEEYLEVETESGSRNKINFELQTTRDSGGYWMDSGSLDYSVDY